MTWRFCLRVTQVTLLFTIVEKLGPPAD